MLRGDFYEDGGAVLLSEEAYEGSIETLKLLSIPGFYETIQQADVEIGEGDTYSMDDAFGDE